MGINFKRLFKTLVESINICFSIMLVVGIVGTLLGSNVTFSYYLKLTSIASLILTVIFFALKVNVNYLKNVRYKIFKTLVQSAIICFPIMLVLLIINAFLGVHVRFSYYFKLTLLSTVGLTLVLCLQRFDIIFRKAPKAPKKNISTNNTNRKVQRSVHRKRKRIS